MSKTSEYTTFDYFVPDAKGQHYHGELRVPTTLFHLSMLQYFPALPPKPVLVTDLWPQHLPMDLPILHKAIMTTPKARDIVDRLSPYNVPDIGARGAAAAESKVQAHRPAGRDNPAPVKTWPPRVAPQG